MKSDVEIALHYSRVFEDKLYTLENERVSEAEFNEKEDPKALLNKS